MPERPGIELESLLAADEAAIRDDGFSAGVMRRVEKQVYLRRFAIYGAGMAGFGLAAGGLTRIGDVFPAMSSWVGGLASVTDGLSVQRVGDLLANGNAAVPAVLIAALGAAFFVVTATLQER